MRRLSGVYLLALCFPLAAQTIHHPATQGAVACVNRYDNNKRTTQHEFDAMVDFTFNVGCGAFRRSTLLKDVNAGKMGPAASEFMKWTYVGKKQVRGLVKRRTDERNLFLKP
jgi:lysozyme